MGNKKKLIKKGLIDLFPNDIRYMIEPFGGSAVVSMNTKAKRYYIGDNDENLVALYKLFKCEDSKKIINHIENRIEEFELPKERTRRCTFKDKEKLECYKKAYMNFRKYYNDERNVMDFYTLTFYSFSQQFNFNKKGEFNMPYGTDCFSEKNKEYIKDGCDFFKKNNVLVGKCDFKNLNIDLLTTDDFVYLDPPYLNTTATYNNSWKEKDENDLYKFCEELNNRGIKFGMSNVFLNKGKSNDKLKEWCEKNNWNVYTFNNFTYSACGKGNSEAVEVFIRNF
jgi:DNA adenine methylase Dam